MNQNNDFLKSARCTEPRTPLAPLPSGTIATKVHGNIYYKYERAVRIPINGFVPERDFGIRVTVADIIIQGSNINHK